MMVLMSPGRSTSALRWAVAAIVLLAAALLTLFSSSGVSLASSGKYIRLCMAAMPNGDEREQGGNFTYNFYANGNPAPFASLTMTRLEDPGIFCEDFYPSDHGVSDAATFVVELASKPPSWNSKPSYPQYLLGNPPLAPGDTTPPFTIAAQWTTVYFYDWSEVAPRLLVCKGIEQNGDAVADTGTFQFSVAVKGQAPFQTVSLSAIEDNEEACADIYMEDVPLALPVTLVITELDLPGFQNAPGYPQHSDPVTQDMVSGGAVEVTIDASNREERAWFMNRRVAAPIIPDIPEVPVPIETPTPVNTPTPAPTVTATPPAPTATAPSTPAPSTPTPTPTMPGGTTAGATTTPLPPRTGDALSAPSGDTGLGLLFLALAALSGGAAVVAFTAVRRD